MAELITAIQNYAGWLYAFLGLLVAHECFVAWQTARDRGTALFGLEREAAAGRAIRSAVTTLLLVAISVGVYTVANVIAPALPEETVRHTVGKAAIVETPVIVPFPSDTPTRPPATATLRVPRIFTATPRPAGGATGVGATATEGAVKSAGGG